MVGINKQISFFPTFLNVNLELWMEYFKLRVFKNRVRFRGDSLSLGRLDTHLLTDKMSKSFQEFPRKLAFQNLDDSN